MPYITIPVTAFQQNCTLIWCESTRKTAIVDPGGDIDQILRILEREELEAQKILITHGHIDHAGGAADLADRLSIPIEGPQEADRFWIERMTDQAGMFGVAQARSFAPDRWLEQGDRVSVGHEELEVLHCPGHTPGHIVFFHRPSRLALVGDVLFKGSIGRTDFPLGNYEDLIHSIRQRLWPLGPDVRFIPGHGPESTFGEERRSNPFVADGR